MNEPYWINEQYWIEKGFERERAFQLIARSLGKQHAITQMMNGLAYGQHPWKLAPNPNPQLPLAGAIERAGVLAGAFHILAIWARDNDPDTHDIRLTIWTRLPHGIAGQQWWEANGHLFGG